MKGTPYDPFRVLRTLVAHEVNFVLIGGVAMRLHGSPRVTNDTDICYDAGANLDRLVSALTAMNARRITDLEPDGAEITLTKAYLEGEDAFAFMTDAGQVDVIASPLGVGDFHELRNRAVVLDLDGTVVRLASIDALRDMKRARDWPVDRTDLEILVDIEQEQRGPD